MASPQPLSTASVAALLTASLETVLAELGALDGEQARWRPAPDAWCANEIVGHLIEAEQRGFAGRIMHILQADYPTFLTWDQPAVARERHDELREPADLLREFEELRRASLELVDSLQPHELTRAGRHPVVGELTIQDLLHEWVFHDRNHLAQLYDNVKALAWPFMGNCQRFAMPVQEAK